MSESYLERGQMYCLMKTTQNFLYKLAACDECIRVGGSSLFAKGSLIILVCSEQFLQYVLAQIPLRICPNLMKEAVING